MEERTKKTGKTYESGSNHLIQRVIGIIFIIIEVILGFRLIFKLLGANAENFFVKLIYDVSQIFVGVFEGIFSTASTEGLETKAVFEPATLIAMVVIAIIAWIILKLIKPRDKRKVEKEEIIEKEDDKEE